MTSKVDLTRRIREVLFNYPEGTTVLKELIQNADDAGATRILCCRTLCPSGRVLISWRTTMLFNEEDFVSISRIGGSGKHRQAWKTGDELDNVASREPKPVVRNREGNS
ncbi:unnamed protein product [Thlaspi arvense]|uniref:Sacsin/Nov domain-containing protein n=1 Tax=Thlaspi arvense TaxID=13288 RepID=A0AAU9SUI1_THLAR|nr:unnamed protein product [Thlaspi arvense]